MLRWVDHYYVGSGIKDSDKIRKKIDQGNITPDIYVLTLSDNPGNLLEMFPSVLLKQRWMRELCPTIIGMARGKDGAIELVTNILLEIYRETGEFQVEDYIKNR